MENPTRRRRSSDSNSPEFEFWKLRNPSAPEPNLLSADELFSDGFLLPLRLLNQNTRESEPPQLEPPGPSTSDPPATDPEPGPEMMRAAAVTESSSVSTGSKRWKDIFKKSEKKSVAGEEQGKEKDKERKRERKGQFGAGSAAELNIHLWPFSRSRSAGNGGGRPRNASGGRKVSSAPCSRSNSAGESKSRKWPSSPGRTGVHLGRSSPVWQVRRTGSGRNNPVPEPTSQNAEKLSSEKGPPEPRRSKAPAARNDGRGAKSKVSSLNAPCRNHLSNPRNAVIGGDSNSAGGDMGNGGGGTLFNIRNLFTKKVC